MSLINRLSHCILLSPMKTQIRTMNEVQEFFKSRGLVYLDRTRCLTPEVTQYRWGDSPYYHANKDEFEVLTQRYGDAIRSGTLAALYL